MENKKNIAIFTDAHSMMQPVEAIIADAKKQGVEQIYSLGDNIGVGPNPKEVMDLIMQNNVISVAGNYEDIIDFGVAPFLWYMGDQEVENMQWTKSELTMEQIINIKTFPHCKELVMGGKKIALCHFANDVRAEFDGGSCWTYKDRIDSGYCGYRQFAYTNSDRNIKDLAIELNIDWKNLKKLKNNYERMLYMKKVCLENMDYYLKRPELLGCVSNVKDPLFMTEDSLNKVEDYDAIIQGHVHFKLEETADRLYYTVRAAGMGDTYENRDKASYIILEETDNGFDLTERKIPFDYEQMQYNIEHSTIPFSSRIRKFTYTK